MIEPSTRPNTTSTARSVLGKFSVLISLTLLAIAPTKASGPSGMNWPNLVKTPYMYDHEKNHIVTVNPSWGAVSSALAEVTDEQANAGTLILVKPGTITGFGAGSKAKPALKQLGNESWKKRVTIAPEKGYGTVTISGDNRFLLAHNVCIAGFIFEGRVKFEGCNRTALAWSKFDGLLQVLGFKTLPLVEKFELCEITNTESRTENSDVIQFGTQGSDMDQISINGAYLLPHFYVDGASPTPHVDTIQLYAANGGKQTNFIISNSVLFSSNNAALQTGGIEGMKIASSYILGGSVSTDLYPLTPGSSTSGGSSYFSAINGSGFGFEVVDSFFSGSNTVNTKMSDKPWSYVENSVAQYDYNSSDTPANGIWDVLSDEETFKSKIPQHPTDFKLAEIWSKEGITRSTVDPSSLYVE